MMAMRAFSRLGLGVPARGSLAIWASKACAAWQALLSCSAHWFHDCAEVSRPYLSVLIQEIGGLWQLGLRGECGFGVVVHQSSNFGGPHARAGNMQGLLLPVDGRLTAAESHRTMHCRKYYDDEQCLRALRVMRCATHAYITSTGS